MLNRQFRLLSITLLTEFAALLVIFVVSRTLADKHVSLLWMGLIGAGFGLASTLSSAYCGALSDRIGRRRGVVLGLFLALSAVGLTRAGLAGLIPITFSYVVMGVSLGLIYPAMSAWLTEGRASSAGVRGLLRTLIGFSIAWNVGLIGAQISGGLLYEYVSPMSPLALAAGLLILTIVLAWAPMPPAGTTTVSEPGQTDLVTERYRASTIYSRLSWVANIGGTFAMAMILHLFPALMVDLHIEADHHGMIMAFSRLIVVCTYIMLFLTRFWHYRISTSLGAQGLGIGGLLLIGFANGQAGLMLGLALLSLTIGYNYFASLYYSSTRGRDEARGAAMGLHEATLTAGMTGGAALGGLLGSFWGVRSPYMLAAAVIGLLIVVQLSVWIRYRGQLAQPGSGRMYAERACA